MSMFNDIVWDAKGNDEICENDLMTIKQYPRRIPRDHWSFLGPGSEKKWYGTYDHKPHGSRDRIAEKMLLNFAGSGHPVFHGTSALERGEIGRKGSGKKSIHFNGSTQNIELLLFVNQLSIHGAVADMIRENYQLARELWWNPKHQVNWIKWRFLQKCKPMRFEISRSWTLLLCSSVTKRRRKSIFLSRIYDATRSRRNSYQRVDPKQCTIWPRLDIKVCNHNGRYSNEVQAQSLFQDQTVSWIRIANGIDKFVRETMPIQEEQKASGKPAAKARPILKPSSISDVNSILVGLRKWIDTETQESNDLYSFQVSKFITRLLRHSQEVYREVDGAVHYDQVIDECKKKQSDKKDFVISSGKRWRTKLLGSELSSSIPVPSSISRTFRKYNQSCIARQCTVTRRFYRVSSSRRKWKRIEVNSKPWFDSRRSQSQNMQTSCILHYCESDG